MHDDAESCDHALRNGLRPLAGQGHLNVNQHELARVYAIHGDPEKTLDQLEALLATPYSLSPGWLRIDPTYEFLRGHPRFERLVAGD